MVSTLLLIVIVAQNAAILWLLWKARGHRVIAVKRWAGESLMSAVKAYENSYNNTECDGSSYAHKKIALDNLAANRGGG